MANVKFSELTELTATAAADKFAVVDDSEAAVEKSKYVKQSTLRTDFMVGGTAIRSQFDYKDADEVYIGAGYYSVAGKIALWTSRLTKQLTGAAASTWYYLYLDESGITSLTAVTATELLFSTTAPTYSQTYRGWYNSLDRCIFAVRTNASSQIIEFYSSGDSVFFADAIACDIGGLGTGFVDVDTTWLDATLIAPGFCRQVIVTLGMFRDGSNAEGYWRVNGQTGTVGHVYAKTSEASAYSYLQALVITDSSQKIEMVHSSSNSCKSSVDTDGWSFPVGM